MSGDLQARKRRDKKKRKDDAPDVPLQQVPPTLSSSSVPSDDVDIHVHREASTGGGLCAKLIFFILLGIIVAFIGLNITEHRGLTDLDTIDTETYFARIFEGWVDTHVDDHDEDDHHASLEHSEEAEDEEHDDEDSIHTEEDEEEEDEEELEDTHEVEETEENESAIQDETTETESIQEETAEAESIQEDTAEAESTQDETAETESIQDETAELVEESEPPEESEVDEHSETAYLSEYSQQDDTTQETQEDDEYEEDDDDEEEQPEDTAEKTEESAEVESKDNATGESEKDDDQEDDEVEDVQQPSEKVDSSENLVVDKSEEVDKEADAEVSKEDNQEDDREEEKQEDKVLDETIPNEDDTPQSGRQNMVVRVGVGTALLVVAYVVLIQKWKTEGKDDDDDDRKPLTKTASEQPEDVGYDLTRRNTLIPPPQFEEVEPDIVTNQEEYSSEEEESEPEEEEDLDLQQVRYNYEEIQSKYDSNTLSPNWKSREDREKFFDNSEEVVDEEEEEYDDENVRYEDEEDYEKNSNEDLSDNENEELLKRLEARYGLLNKRKEEYEEEEEVEEEEEDYDQIDDYQSWKRVNMYTDELSEGTDSEDDLNQHSRQGGAQSVYEFGNITNSNDWEIRDKLDSANEIIDQDAAYALTLFNALLRKSPSSPRALYGKAKSLDILAEERKSNNLLQQAISTYQEVLNAPNVPDYLFQISAERCIDRMRFRGIYQDALKIHNLLVVKFPNNVNFRNSLAVTYLTINKMNLAKQLLKETLLKFPHNGFALVHYGFILKTLDNDLKNSIDFLKRGIATKEPGVIDGRFYFHLGDALTRLGRNDEAMNIYEDGVRHKLFLSKYQRSLYNVDRLVGKPWWTKSEVGYGKFLGELESNWKNILREGLSVLGKDGYFVPESENLRDVGDWKQFVLFARGIKHVQNCKQCPSTCKLIETLSDASGCKRGQVKFSVMHPGTHVWPHCGPTNCRLRIHLGLKVPSGTYIRVQNEIRSWKEGKLLIFDDSFEHEVWHNGSTFRLVLIVDVWHPELTNAEKRKLSPI